MGYTISAYGTANGGCEHERKLFRIKSIVYRLFAQKVQGLVQAQCWSHTRRQFVDIVGVEPRLVAVALDHIEGFYRQEAEIRKRGLVGAAKLAYRGEYTKPLVEDFFVWLKQTVTTEILLPTNPFGQAAEYAFKREAALKVFLTDPDVPIDTNHLCLSGRQA